MCKSLQLTLCDTQGQLFELAAERGYSSEAFIKAFMTSQVSADMDKEFHHVQWAGKAYILSRMEDELAEGLTKDGEIYDKETLYWAGYIYRYWSFYTGESSREIYKQAPAKTMKVVYLMYHTMSPEMAIDRLKEAYEEKKVDGKTIQTNAETKSLEELFSIPLPSSRSGVFNNTFPYPTRISPEAIAVYIACATNPGDTVLDAFSGSGSTGIAALLCEHPTEEMKEIAKQLKANPKWGKRNAILYEIGTYASFATRTLLNGLTAKDYESAVNSFVTKAEEIVGNYYSVRDPEGKRGYIRHIIWTEILKCPSCQGEVSYFQYGTTKNPVEFKDSICCPHCGVKHTVSDMPFVTETYFDRVTKKHSQRKKRLPAWIYGSTNSKNWDRCANEDDILQFNKIEESIDIESEAKKIVWGELHRAGYHFGIEYLHQFYTTRNYGVILSLWKLAEEYPTKIANALKLLLLSYNSAHCTLMTRVVAKKNSKDFVLTSAQSGVLYISKLPVEKNILLGLKRKAKPFIEAYALLEKCSGKVVVNNSSSTRMLDVNGSIDFVFTDPPFGDFIPYAEVNQINELWLQNQTNRTDEVIISTSQNKDIVSYQSLLSDVFKEIHRVLKPNNYVAVVFHAAKAKVWEAFQHSISDSGLSIISSSILDKKQASFKQVVSDGSVQGDPMFLLQKITMRRQEEFDDMEILDELIRTHISDKTFDDRRCYSLYISKCIEHGITKTMDAKMVYDYFRRKKEDRNGKKKK